MTFTSEGVRGVIESDGTVTISDDGTLKVYNGSGELIAAVHMNDALLGYAAARTTHILQRRFAGAPLASRDPSVG